MPIRLAAREAGWASVAGKNEAWALPLSSRPRMMTGWGKLMPAAALEVMFIKDLH
jgi:hypothetical protein